jgi:hypothetical protein
MRARRISVIAAALVVLVAIPAFAAYTGTYAPTQSVLPRQLLTPSSFACTSPSNNSVALSWTDTDGATADPYGAFVITDYVIERSVNGGGWTQVSRPARTLSAASDTSFGLLGLGDLISYRMRSTKSTNWVSADTNTVTAKVTSLILFTHVTCPFP